MGVADLRSSLATHRLICVDTMVFIYLLDANPHYVDWTIIDNLCKQ